MKDIDTVPILSPESIFTKRIFSFTEIGLTKKSAEEPNSQLPKITKPKHFIKIEDPKPVLKRSLRSLTSCKHQTRPSTGWDDFLKSNIYKGNTTNASFTLSPTILYKIDQTNEQVQK